MYNPILMDTLPPCCAHHRPALLLGVEVSGEWQIQGRASCIFFLNQGKKKRNRDFVSGNPLLQQPCIQPAPVAAGLGGDLADPESGGGSRPWGCLVFQWWVSGSGSTQQGRQGTGTQPRGLQGLANVLAGYAEQCFLAPFNHSQP